jgi:hypothetical protein
VWEERERCTNRQRDTKGGLQTGETEADSQKDRERCLMAKIALSWWISKNRKKIFCLFETRQLGMIFAIV